MLYERLGLIHDLLAVKTPVIGEVSGAAVEFGATPFQGNRRWLDVAVGRWRVFNETLCPSGKRPVHFVMCENTLAAEEAGDHDLTV